MSPGDMIVEWRRFLLRLVDLLVRIWLVNALFRLILPVPVLLNRLAAPLFVFILGIICSSVQFEKFNFTQYRIPDQLFASGFFLKGIWRKDHAQRFAFLLGGLFDLGDILHCFCNPFK